MKLVLNWLIAAAAIVISAYLLPGVGVSGFVVALILAIVLGAINIFIRPLLVLLTLPITLFTFGLFLFVINALLILLAAEIVPGFTVDGFWWALLFSAVLSLISSVLQSMGSSQSYAQ